MDMTMPTFMIIGAQKSGTTSLYYHLAQHPEIYMCPVKEPDFFCFSHLGLPRENITVDFEKLNNGRLNHKIKNIENYKYLFSRIRGEKAAGEASVKYISSPEAAENIGKMIPDVRLIAILRNPVDRAYSEYRFMHGLGVEKASAFARALEKGVYDYRAKSFYYQQLKRYYDIFDRGQIAVYLFEDYKSDPAKILKDIYGHIGVDTGFKADLSAKHNVSRYPAGEGVLRNMFFRPNPIKAVILPLIPRGIRMKLRNGLISAVRRAAPPMDPAIRESLYREYAEDIANLQGLIKKDLSCWLKEAGR
jgi:hypothetical protein